MKKVLVLTGGGLSPSLNPTIAGILAAAKKIHATVIGGIEGYRSLLPHGRTLNITHIDPRIIKNSAGDILRSSRVNPTRETKNIAFIKKFLISHRIDGVITIGGDDTLGTAVKLHAAGIPIIGIPKTIDNDLPGTYWTPGYPTAAVRMAHFAQELRTHAAYTLNRIFVMEALGGSQASWLAAAAALGGADVIIPCEREHKLARVLSIIKKRYDTNGNFALVVMAQEAQFDQPLTGMHDSQSDHYHVQRTHYRSLALGVVIQNKLGIDTKVIYPGALLETALAIPLDRDLSFKLGVCAVALVQAKKFGTYVNIERPSTKKSTLIISNKKIIAVNATPRVLDNTFFDFKNYTIRPAFRHYLDPIATEFPQPNYPYCALLRTVIKTKQKRGPRQLL